VTRWRAAAGVALATALGCSASASAGEYEVISCAAAGGTNHAWQGFNADPAALDAGDGCSTVLGGPDDGLFAVDRIPGPPNASAGREAGWRVAAPTGTRISRLTAHYYLGQRSSGEWLPFVRTAEGIVLDTCVPTGGETTCERGSSAYDPLAPVGVYSVDTAAVEAGVRCGTSSGACVNGASLHAAWTALYATRLQITDPTLPALSTPGGALWSDGYHRGIETATLAASDNTGIRDTKLLIDGMSRSVASRGCDFTLVVPCSAEPGATLALDTHSVADGAHQLTAVADDAAGNAASTSRTLVVDNGAPAAPVGLALEGDERRATNAFAVHWGTPEGQVAPIAAVDWSLCPANVTTGCATGRRAQAGIERIDDLAVPMAGDWDLRVWLEDAAGNVDVAKAAGPLRLSLGTPAGTLRDPGPVSYTI
jgi:hypothetical protein